MTTRTTMNNELDMKRIPTHVAIIMDGNGRWAAERGKERSFGHQAVWRQCAESRQNVSGWALSTSRCTPSLRRTGIGRKMRCRLSWAWC